MAEYHHGVASLNLGITVDENTLVVAHQTTDGNTKGQTQILNRFLGDTRTFGGNKFSYVTVDHHQGADIGDIRVEHHLVDVTSSQRLLINNGTDIQTLCHFHVVQILNHSDRLAHT